MSEHAPRERGARGFEEFGAGEEIRTPDPRITNALLYQLSYPGEGKNFNKFSSSRCFDTNGNSERFVDVKIDVSCFAASIASGINEFRIMTMRHDEINEFQPTESGAIADGA